MRIVYMGTPDFAVPALDKLVEHGHRPIAVVTGPHKPRGRGQRVTPTAVWEAATRHGIEPILQPESVRDPDFANAIAALEPDLIVVVAFRILPPQVFLLPTFGSINLHGSLLPRYRGAAPINRAIMAGERETGVTTFFLQEKVDTGNVILQRVLSIGHDETAGEVHDRMMHLGAEVVLETVQLIERQEVTTTPQDETLASPAPKIHAEDAHIAWDRPAIKVHDHIRALSPYPGASTRLDGRQFKIFRTRLIEGDREGLPGTITIADGRMLVACREHAVEAIEVQQEGRRRMSAQDFLRGTDLGTNPRFES
jgi:methionyl-tRNA formyltransferase